MKTKSKSVLFRCIQCRSLHDGSVRFSQLPTESDAAVSGYFHCPECLPPLPPPPKGSTLTIVLIAVAVLIGFAVTLGILWAVNL